MKYLFGLLVACAVMAFVNVAEARCHGNSCNQRVVQVQRVVTVQRVVVPQAFIVSEFVEVPNLQIVVNQHGNVRVEEVVLRQNVRDVQNVNVNVRVNNRHGIFGLRR
jgi:hypothetical protein